MKGREIQLDVHDLSAEEELKLLSFIKDFAEKELPENKKIYLWIKDYWERTRKLRS